MSVLLGSVADPNGIGAENKPLLCGFLMVFMQSPHGMANSAALMGSMGLEHIQCGQYLLAVERGIHA